MNRKAKYETMRKALTGALGDLNILCGNVVGPSDSTWQDVAGTCAANMEVLATQLTQARLGNKEAFLTFQTRIHSSAMGRPDARHGPLALGLRYRTARREPAFRLEFSRAELQSVVQFHCAKEDSMTIDTVLQRGASPTKAQLAAGFQVLTAVSETIRELGEVPSGHIYTLLMDRVDLAGFAKMVAILKGAGLVSESGDVLRWIGPTLAA